MNGLPLVSLALALLCTTGTESRVLLPSEPPCQAGGLYMPGAYRPQCTKGYFNVIQRYGSTGESWCANPETGAKVESSTVRVPVTTPKCGKCFIQLSQFLQAGVAIPHLLGRIRPACDDEGRYQPEQHHLSTGYSWCVDPESGTPIAGTTVAPGGQRDVDCGATGPCAALQKPATGLVGAFQAQCTKSGYFNVVQIHASSGFSWCANPQTGAKVEASSIRGEPKCGKCFYDLSDYLNAATLLGRAKPDCTDDGYYKPMQVHASSGYSFCVDPETGAKIEGSEVAPAAGRANCEAGLGLTLGPCAAAFQAAKPMIGTFVAECDDQGYYKKQQFNPSTGYSFCVDRQTGAKIEGSEVAPGHGQANCEAGLGLTLGPCAAAFQAAKPMIGTFVAECDDQGYYKAYQWNPSTGYTFCVDRQTGATIEGSEVAPGAGLANCGGPVALTLGPCAAAFQASKPMIGTFVAQCDDQGYYKKQQFNPSTGYSFCVDRQTGAKIQGSDVAPGTGQANCEAAPLGLTLGPCAAEFQAAKPLLGTFVPRCDDRGYYTSIQTHEGHRFCVDTNTGKQLPGSPSLGPGDNGKLPCEN